MYIETALPISFLFTVCLEYVIIVHLLRMMLPMRGFGVVFSVHAITHPIGILFFYHIIGVHVLIVELGIILAEASLYTLLCAISFRSALAVSCIANTASFGLGILFWTAVHTLDTHGYLRYTTSL